LLLAGGVLLIAAALLILIPRQNRERVVVSEGESAPIEVDIPFPDVPRISISDTKARFDDNSAVIIDVRSADAYLESHIPNALSLPEEDIEGRANELSMDAEILLYCT